MINNIKNNKEPLNSIPELPGIYKMLDSRNNIIYIGKSKCLRKRVKSYFASSPKWEKVKKMVSLIDQIDYQVTDTHLEARLLECALIKEYRPHFNSQMKHDRNYVYLKIGSNSNKELLSLVDQREENTYGPFRRKYNLHSFIDLLKNYYPITEQGTTYEFDYHLFPMVMDQTIFEENLRILTEVLTDLKKLDQLTKRLEDKMMEASLEYRYEAASGYRDLLQGFLYIRNGIDGYHSLFTKNIVLKLPTQDGEKLFYIRNGHILLTSKYNTLTTKEMKKFLDKGNKMQINLPVVENEKAGIDFRDIIYSEIKSLPEDLVTILENPYDNK